ncbi:MAG: SDR family oxidoreductase [Mucilaginibacter sp.]|uniref:SDR family oxidoreductase n=1 Tax=Mucilaginibacter sp. TaxID=1882438 RepID=UPI0031B2F5CB
MSYKFSLEEWETCMKVLETLRSDPFENPDNDRLKTLVTDIHRQAKKQKKKVNTLQRREHDNLLVKNTAVVSNASNQTTEFAFTTSHNPEPALLFNTRFCYSCNAGYTQLHFFYHRLCPACAALNYEHRFKQHNFEGYNVVVTGGRVKVGYATALQFLRSGAKVLLTTRFPALALEQLQKEPDYITWQNAITVYGLDLRNLQAVDHFIVFCKAHFTHLDILVNNAAQTIKYTADYYQPLIAREHQLLLQNPAPQITANQTPVTALQNNLPMPEGLELQINRFGQPVDHRDQNSWNSTLTEIGLEELLEVNLINQISPYRMIAGLKSLMINSPHAERFVINVTSSEGQFNYPYKTIFHPHTNMTKAALNMLTRTTAPDFIKDGIYMTGVDVGWISTGAVESKRALQFERLKIPPLDPLDGAMRIIQPITDVLAGNKTLFGILLKDYKPAAW